MRTHVLFIAIMLMSVTFGAPITSASAQSRTPHQWWASDRMGGRNEIDATFAPLRIHVSFRRLSTARYAFTVSVAHTGVDPITQLHVRLSAVNSRCAVPAFPDQLAPGSQSGVDVICEDVGELFQSDAIWDLNRPLSLQLEFIHGANAVSQTIPVGYVDYSGWATSYSYRDAGVLMMLMSREPAPALHGIVATVRRRAEQIFGRPLDGSTEARLAAARAVADYVLVSGLRYDSGGTAYQGPYPSANTVSFPAEFIAYGYGACMDFAVLGGFLLHALGVPYGIFSSPGHAATFVEIARTRATSGTHATNVLEAPCGTDRCSYLALDLSQIRVAASADELLRASHDAFTALSEEPYEVFSSSERGLVVPQGTLLGRSWLGSSPDVSFMPPPALDPASPTSWYRM